MGAMKKEESFLDPNGRKVHSFAMEISNLGFTRMGELLAAMLESGAWKKFKTGLGPHEFLEGEFDYFLSQQGVDREQVMQGVRNVEIKAKLEASMDERRTGEARYRRAIEEARKAIPQQPGRPIVPFGLTEAEARVLANGSGKAPAHRPALGGAVRQYTLNGGKRVQRPSDVATPVERLQKAASKLSDDELNALIGALQTERKERKGQHLRASNP